MARIRTVKPDFWTNEKVMSCGLVTRLLFIGMWNFADDYGRIQYSTVQIKAKIFPNDSMPLDDVRDMLTELSVNGLLVIYSANGKEYIEITGWDHQKIDKRQVSKIPGPFDDGSAVNECNSTTPADSRRLTPTPAPVMEGKGMDRKEDIRAVVKTTRTDDCFEEFWSSMPKRDGANPKEPARKLFLAAVKSGEYPARIIAGARQCARAEAKNANTPYIPQAVKWLRDKRWLDYAADADAAIAAAARAAALVRVEPDTPQWDAWTKHQGKSPPRDTRGGWMFPSEWPPGHEPQRLAS